MEIVAFEGWDRCAKLSAGELELIVTLDVGPRVLFLGHRGGPNQFLVYDKSRGLTGGDEHRGYGGHRLWTAPEDLVRTYEPDNDPVETRQEGEWFVFAKPLGPTKLLREIWIKPDAANERFLVRHRVKNEGAESHTIAAWGITVCPPGGTCLFPMPPHKDHPAALLPGAPLAIWSYTKLNDPRYTWGARVSRLAQDSAKGPTKVGLRVPQGWAAYGRDGNLFLKRFALDDEATYPDYNVNFETFTRHDMLEVETLGPLVTLGPGDETGHAETWYVVKDFGLDANEESLADRIEAVVAARPLS